MSKVIIPNFVAAHIENDKDINFSIHESINHGYMNDSNDKVNRWLYDNSVEENDKRILTFVRAWVEGYEVEPELKYYWRKKKEYLASFEDEQYLFADEHEKTTVLSKAYASKFDETELMNVIGSVDLDKFEKVEIN